MEQLPTVEDARGVDVGQIQRQLRMSVPERVESMLHVANVMMSIQKTAQASLRRQTEDPIHQAGSVREAGVLDDSANALSAGPATVALSLEGQHV